MTHVSFVLLVGLLSGCHLALPLSPGKDAGPPADLIVPGLDLPTGRDLKPDQPPPPDVGVDGGAPPGWAQVPAGHFTMGALNTETCDTGTSAQHAVTLTHGFEIQATEVTQVQFRMLMGYNPSTFTACGDTCPVDSVSWHEATGYCNALSDAEGRSSCYTCTGAGSAVECAETGGSIYKCGGYRLPTEAEWEHAYRAGTTTMFYNGNFTMNDLVCEDCGPNAVDPVLDDISWYCANSAVSYPGCAPTEGGGCGGTHPVGKKIPNVWLIHDMAGNVAEWCHDWLVPATAQAAQDPVGTYAYNARVVRGGSWYHAAYHARAAYRSGATPTIRLPSIGFRCVRTLLSP